MFPNRNVLTTLRVNYLIPLLLCLMTIPACAAAPDADAINTLTSMQNGFRAVHGKVSPSVVSIISQITEETPIMQNPFPFFFNNPLPNMQLPNIQRRVQAMGSGVIIRKDGYVLTNSHVVNNATKVTVQLSGSKDTLAAEVVQTDPHSDLAIVKITEKGEHNFPVATLGDAKSVQVGDWAIAFGSPYSLNLATTMTVGVISATGRQLNSPDDQNRFSDLLQTDASINPGNSGGPLCNIRGEVIGINFMIYSPGSNMGSAGSVGIGFAIPINENTRQIIDTLVTGHPVVRGRLGILVRNLDATMRDHYGVATGGILVDNVMSGQAADKAGIKDEDIIIEYNKMKVTDSEQFVQLVEHTAPGTKVPVIIIRNKQEQHINVTVGEAPSETQRAAIDQSKVGLKVTTLTREISAQYRLPMMKGVVITQVDQGGPADETGLQPGDIIIRVGDELVTTENEFWTALGKAMAVEKHGVLLRIQRGNIATTLSMPIIEDLTKKKK